MKTYFEVLQVVMAILTPLFFWLLIVTIRDAIQYRTEKEQRKIKELEKLAPFDDNAEFFKVPNPEMIGVKLKKNGQVVWDGAVNRNNIEL